MKLRSLCLALALGLAAGLVGCQDQGVLAPDDLQPQFAKGGNGKPAPSRATVTLAGALLGEQADWGWEYTKKGILAANGSMVVTTDFTEGQISACTMEEPEGADTEPLLTALADGLTGKSAVLRVDMGSLDGPSDVNRITVLVESDAVRYFWIGPSGEFGGDDATVSDFSDVGGTISYTLSGGIIGVRDNESPKKAVKLACPFEGTVTVTIVK